jgi:hypothetical protein
MLSSAISVLPVLTPSPESLCYITGWLRGCDWQSVTRIGQVPDLLQVESKQLEVTMPNTVIQLEVIIEKA